MTYWLAQTENNARASAAGFASTLPWKASGQLGTGVGAGGAEFQLQAAANSLSSPLPSPLLSSPSVTWQSS